jgi:hypothetical protein
MSHIPSDDVNQCLHIFKEYKDNEQYLTYPSERLVETVSASVTVLEGMMAEVAHT